MLLAAALDFDIIQVMACVFTILSGVASIALTIHKFGLTTWKKAVLIVGVLVAGLVIVIGVIPMISDQKLQAEAAPAPVAGIVGAVGGLKNVGTITSDGKGGITTTAGSGVKDVSGDIYSMATPEGVIHYARSGANFKAKLKGEEVECMFLVLDPKSAMVVYGKNVQHVPGDDAPFKVTKIDINIKS